MAELEEAQGENRKILLEKERQTLQEHENKFVTMRDDWKNELPDKKLVSYFFLLLEVIVP